MTFSNDLAFWVDQIVGNLIFKIIDFTSKFLLFQRRKFHFYELNANHHNTHQISKIKTKQVLSVYEILLFRLTEIKFNQIVILFFK